MVLLCIETFEGENFRENFVVLWLYIKVSLRNLGMWRPLAQQKQAIRASFSGRIVFFANSQKFSPSKVSRYMVATCNQLTTVMNRLKKSFFSNFSYSLHMHIGPHADACKHIFQHKNNTAVPVPTYVTDSQVSFLFNPSLSQYYCQREPSNTGEPGWWTGFCFLSHPPSALVSTQL